MDGESLVPYERCLGHIVVEHLGVEVLDRRTTQVVVSADRTPVVAHSTPAPVD
jgi:hypothetical protein